MAWRGGQCGWYVRWHARPGLGGPRRVARGSEGGRERREYSKLLECHVGRVRYGGSGLALLASGAFLVLGYTRGLQGQPQKTGGGESPRGRA